MPAIVYTQSAPVDSAQLHRRPAPQARGEGGAGKQQPCAVEEPAKVAAFHKWLFLSSYRCAQ
eukprot:8382004-Pyramimonas_sp.AAC.1